MLNRHQAVTRLVLSAGFVLAGLCGSARAGDHDLSLSRFAPQDAADEGGSVESTETTIVESYSSGDYREVSSFFNIREANSNVHAGEWEFELTAAWVTRSSESSGRRGRGRHRRSRDRDGETDDSFTLTPSIKYGITDDLFVELEVLPINLGDGGEQGNGDLGLTVFYQCTHEDDVMPAIASWIEMRIPTGEGSSGVDAELHLNLSKSVATNCRAHLEGFVETANGGRGGDDENRRAFQWGIGPGFDYRISDQTIAVINYLHRSSEEYGHSNQNILQLGMAHEITEGQHLKLAVDIGLDNHEETPNFGTKVQWAIEW